MDETLDDETKRPPRPPSPMKLLHDDLVGALRDALKDARELPDAVHRARALAALAQGFAHLDQAASQRTLARIQTELAMRTR